MKIFRILGRLKYICNIKLDFLYINFYRNIVCKFIKNSPCDFNTEGTYDKPYSVTSQLCNKSLFDLPYYSYWMDKLKKTKKYHRKQWELAYVCQALYETGMLEYGKKGLVFGVGKERTVPLFASLGCKITATDMPIDNPNTNNWRATNQYINKDFYELNEDKLCDDNLFKQNVQFKYVDMNNIPPELKNYDFCWSICALEHLGSIQKGLDFIKNSLNVLKPGGIAIHTTEFNIASDSKTIENDSLVVFRKCDILQLIDDLQKSGNYVFPLVLDKGKGLVNDFVDRIPYNGPFYLKLKIGKFICTSVGLIIVKGKNPLKNP